MRYFTLALFLVLTNTCHAGIVYNNTSTSSSVTISSSSTTLGSRGQTFTNGSLAAQILSVTVYLKNTTGATGNISIVMRTLTGTPGLPSGAVPDAASAVATSSLVNVNTIGNSLTAVTFDFTGTPITLNNDTNYGFTVYMQNVIGSLELYYGSQITNQNSYTTNPLAADLTNDIAGQVIVTPEPATIVLFGSAMAIASAGTYLKRRKQKTANPG